MQMYINSIITMYGNTKVTPAVYGW